MRTVRRSKTRFPRGSGARSGRARERGHFPVRRRTARVSSAGDTVPRHAIGRCDNFVELGTEEMAKLRRGRSIARALDAVLQWQYPGGGRDGLLTQFAGVGCGPQCFRAAETFAAMATIPVASGAAAAAKTKICGREISFALHCFASRFVAEARRFPLWLRLHPQCHLHPTIWPTCDKNRKEFILPHSLLVASRGSKILRNRSIPDGREMRKTCRRCRRRSRLRAKTLTILHLRKPTQSKTNEPLPSFPLSGKHRHDDVARHGRPYPRL